MSFTFDRAFIMHVGMNIADKQSLAAELYRVLRPGGKLGIYDIMQMGGSVEPSWLIIERPFIRRKTSALTSELVPVGTCR